MMEFGLFSVLLGLVGLVSFIWLLVVAFRESLIWGFLVFLFSPISAIAFSIYHWDEAKKPFLIYLSATIIFFAIFFNAFNKMGGLEMIATTQEAAEQLEKGEISEAEAARRVAEQMENNIKRMEEAGLLGTEERKLLEEKVQELKLDESASASTAPDSAKDDVTQPPAETVQAKSDAADMPAPAAGQSPAGEVAPTQKAAEEILEYGPEWSLEAALEKKREKFKQQQLDLPTPKIEGKYTPISVSQAEKYVGEQVRVVKAKTRHDGLLKSVNENHLILDMQVSGGQAHFEIKRHQIHSMYRLTIPDKEQSAGNKKAGQ